MLNIILCCWGGGGGGRIPQSVGVRYGSQLITQAYGLKSGSPVLETKSTLGNIMNNTHTNKKKETHTLN